MALITATRNNFEEIISQEKAVIEFWAPWCGYCKRLGPVMKALGEELTDLTIAQVNIDDLEEISDRYGIETIPSIIAFHKHEASKPLIAPQAKAAILDYLKQEHVIE